MGKRYTEDEIELIKVCLGEGWSYVEIGIILNRVESAIRKKCSNLGLKSISQVKTHEQYVKELAESGSNMKVLETYINAHTKILHECLKCGIQYKCKPNNKLIGKKCSYCKEYSNKNIDPYAPGITYLVDFYEINVIKPGVTNRNTKLRNGEQGQKYEIILQLHFNTTIEAMQKEKEWLDNTKHLQINTGLLKSGNTETFRDLEYRK